jgi:hypothetical protein
VLDHIDCREVGKASEEDAAFVPIVLSGIVADVESAVWESVMEVGIEYPDVLEASEVSVCSSVDDDAPPDV